MRIQTFLILKRDKDYILCPGVLIIYFYLGLGRYENHRFVQAIVESGGGPRSQLRFERHPSVHKLFLHICGVSGIIAENDRSLCQSSFYQNSCYFALTHPTLVFTHESP